MNPRSTTPFAVRPVDAGMVEAATRALADAGTPGLVAVVDLDRVHLVTPGDDRGLVALQLVLERVGTHLRGRAPWLRLETDVFVVVAPAVADEAAARALAHELMTVVDDALAATAPGLPVQAVCGLAWQAVAGTALLPAALEACWRARHQGPPVVLAELPDRWAVRPERAVSPAARLRALADAATPFADESTVDRRPAIDGFLVELSGRALGLEPADFIVGLGDVLGELATVAGADYAFVDVMGPEGTTVENLAGWSGADHPSFVRYEGRPLVPGDDWHRMLVALEPVVVNDQYESHGGEHPGNHPAGGVARSFITIPFVVGGQLAGALGVGTIDRMRPWTSDEVTALRLTTGLVAAVLERVRLARGSKGSQTGGSDR